jgi:hypothetical protein
MNYAILQGEQLARKTLAVEITTGVNQKVKLYLSLSLERTPQTTLYPDLR